MVKKKIIGFGIDGKAEVEFIPIWASIEQSIKGYELRDKELRWTCNNRKCSNYHQKIDSSHEKCPRCSRKLREMEIDYLVDDVTYQQPISISYETAAIELSLNSQAIGYFQDCVAEFKKRIQENIKNELKINREVSEVLNSEPTQLILHTIAHQLILALPLVQHGINKPSIKQLKLCPYMST